MSDKKQEKEEKDWLLSSLTGIIEKKFQEKEKELIQREKEVSEREAKVKHVMENEHTSNQIMLRLGDRVFHCATKVLTSVKDSYFCGLTNPDWEKPKDGVHFIARDPHIFEYVLEFLTYGELVSEISDISTLKKLRLDAEFYSLTELKKQAEKQIENFKNKPQNGPVVSLGQSHIVAKVTNGTLSGSGYFWSWNTASILPAQYFELTTSSYTNDSIVVKQSGTYLINVRVTVVTQHNQYTSLYVNGSEVTRSYSSCGAGNYYQSLYINEIMALNANSRLQIYSTYSSNPQNGNPHNSFSVIML